jgi:hypothetical protein
MELWRIWRPKYGMAFDEYEKLKAGKYEKTLEGQDTETSRGRGNLIRPTGVQL